MSVLTRQINLQTIHVQQHASNCSALPRGRLRLRVPSCLDASSGNAQLVLWRCSRTTWASFQHDENVQTKSLAAGRRSTRPSLCSSTAPAAVATDKLSQRLARSTAASCSMPSSTTAAFTTAWTTTAPGSMRPYWLVDGDWAAGYGVASAPTQAWRNVTGTLLDRALLPSPEAEAVRPAPRATCSASPTPTRRLL